MLFTIILLPWLTLPLLGLCIAGPRNLPAWIAGAADLVALGLLLLLVPSVMQGQVLTARLDWLPAVGLEISFRLDGLSFLFALLVLAIGALIVLYASYYLSPGPRLARFYGLLMLFTGAMLGLVLSENILLLLVFWELTSLSSFLLVGYWHGKSAARDAAGVALAVTGGGGLALLAAVVGLGSIAGSYEFSDLLAARDEISSHRYYEAIVVLLLLGAFTKSAQFPFHFWLPRAMAAPTPVSAYLHSATMVKAGVFLLARFYPLLSGSDLWFYALTGVGLVSLVFGAYQAMFRHDLKGLLAYSTISHLGLITLLLGIATPLSTVAGLFHVVNHATFKASLFMAAGIIDHECGTRNMRRINGLWRYMPYTGLLAMVAAAAMAGVPLVNGFLSKEMFFGEALELQRGGALRWIVPLAAVVAGVFSVAYSLRFIHDVFFLDRTLRITRVPHEPPRWMRIPVEILVAVCLVVGLFPAFSVESLLRVSARAVLGEATPPFSLALWHGVNAPLIMSAIALGAGSVLYFLMQYGLNLHGHVPRRHVAKRMFDRAIGTVARAADRAAGFAYGSGMRGAIAVTLATAVSFGAVPFLWNASPSAQGHTTRVDAVAAVAFALMVAGAIGTVRVHRRRIVALVVLSVSGLAMALAFVYFSAPDLALTQLAVETVSIVLLLLALQRLPPEQAREDGLRRRIWDLLLAGTVGGGVGALSWMMLTRPFASISDYFLRNSVPQGGGANAVNVILVDFRGYDTYGEITVIAIAALGVTAMLHALRASSSAQGSDLPRSRLRPALLLDLLVRVLLPLALLVSAHLFLRGHNEPGGGFIAGLVTALAVVLLYLGGGWDWASARSKLNFVSMAVMGLMVAAATGLAALIVNAPFLTSAHGEARLPIVGEVAFASAMLFDLGVYLVVVGSAVAILIGLAGVGSHEDKPL